ncbi:hypothetical protein LG634_36365 [Streptomyces bambusae]|uniref:hypothetical protein n=1 Tax=Streptomyces bambusae TaxID=1550616 RepID=UPI001CFFC3FA|nr:hypothetical protein [Streptomyces bambusae]MCB5170261.1 hypothetical protein [Streptomyces bambusae]
MSGAFLASDGDEAATGVRGRADPAWSGVAGDASADCPCGRGTCPATRNCRPGAVRANGGS